MLNLKRIVRLISLLMGSVLFDQLSAQCTPPPAEYCWDANVFCSLDQMNGYTCNNPGTVLDYPSGLTSCIYVDSKQHNTSWWAFTSQGGNVSLTLHLGACSGGTSKYKGVTWGYTCDCPGWYCKCSFACIPPFTSQTLAANLIPCHTYYLWMSGCGDDICDFTINTSGGGAPTLSPLSFINNEPSGIIQPVCASSCYYKFFVNPQPGGCEPLYIWTLDGNVTGQKIKNEVFINFPTEGSFVLCVTAYIGNPESGSICAQQGPVCATVVVTKDSLPDKIGVPRTICATPGGYKWGSEYISSSGIYKSQFFTKDCCPFDSVVEFTVLDVPVVTGKPRTLCWEDANPNGYKWNTQLIFKTGTYKERFTDKTNCWVDSLVDFIVQDVPSVTGATRTLCWEDANPNGYKWHDQIIYNTGSYTYRNKNVHCWVDTVVYFTVLDVQIFTGIARTLCWEDANPNGYKWHNQIIKNSGIYKERFTNVHCWFDSAVEFIVLDVPVLNGEPKTICREQANQGYRWHSQIIRNSGTYKERFTNVHCWIDSAVDFTVLDVPDKPEVFYITCNNDPYIDVLGRAHQPCINQFEISLPKITNPFKCDSAIRLTAVNVDFSAPQWKSRCIGGQIEISPNIKILKQCGFGETYQFNYNWYKKNDPVKISISTDEILLVDAVNEDYCLDVNVRVDLGNIFANCSKTYCETYNEGGFTPTCFPLAGDQIVCIGKTGTYWIDTFLSQKVNFYTWTVDGGLVTTKPDSQAVQIKWQLPVKDTGTVCVFYTTDCGKSCEKCIKVIMQTSPAPDAGPNDSICSLANKFQGKKDAGGSWSQIFGPGNSTIKDITDPVSNVVVDKFGMYRFAYTESKSGCASSDSVDLYFNSIPDSSNLIYLCNSKQKQFKLHFLITGGTPPYSVIQGNGIVDVNNFYNSNYYDNLTNYSILIRDAMGCILNFNFSYDCNCTNSITNFIKTPEFKCENQTIVIQAPSYIPDLNDTLIYVVTTDPDPDHAAIGAFIKMLTSTTVLYDASYMNYNTNYYIIILLGKKNGKGGIDFLTSCVQAEGPKSFIFYKIPSPVAGPDDAICGTTYDLKGVQSINGSNLKWRLVGGNGVNIVDDTAASTSVNTNGQYGTYVFELTEDNHNCAIADRVTITFNPSPFIAIDEKICIDYLPPYPYQATIKITNGQPPFTILQGTGTINGNFYTTDTLASLTKFNVEIKDANGCISNLILDNYNCNCGNINAGSLDTELVEVCVDQCVTIKSVLGEIKDPEDAVIYILHQSTYNESNPALPKIDTFYSINDQVCFHPNQMVAGHPYYITRVVGDSSKNNPKLVDNNDPCIRATKNQPIIWYAYPTPDAGPNDSICFYNYQLNGIANTGTLAWKFLSGPGPSNIVNPNSAVTDVNVSSLGTYVYQLTENFKGCISKDTVYITYWDAPKLIDVNPPYECDNTAEHYRVTIDGQNGDRSSWIFKGYAFPSGPLAGNFIAANTWRTDWISNNDIYRLILNDRHNCLPDTVSNTYECPCVNAIGNLEKTPIILCIDEIANANYKANTGTPDGNDVIRFVLYDGNPADPKSGNPLSFNSNGSFGFDAKIMQTGKTYYIAVFMGNMDPNDFNKVLLIDRCLKYDVVPVTWYDNPVASITGIKLLTCTTTTITIDGNGSKSGSGSTLNFSWSTLDGKIVGATINSSAIINASGTYKLIITDPITKCSDEIAFNVSSDFTKPKVIIATPQMISCDNTSVKLDGSSSSQGIEYIIRWTGPGKITNSNTYQPTVDEAGSYQLMITNTNSGCMDSVTVTISGDLKKPIPEIKPIGELTCTNKQIQLDASGSKGQSGPINNYFWQTTNGNIISGLSTSTITIDKPGSYQLQVKNQNNGCDSIATIDVVEIGNPLASIDLIAQDPKCFGEINGAIDINGIFANGPLNGLQYSFNNSAFGIRTNFSNLSQGIYHLKVRDINGCEHDTTVTLIEPGKLGMQVIKSIVVDLDTPVNLDSMILSITGGTKNYKDTTWLNINQNINWPNVHYLADTTRDFLITVIDASGCMIQERVKVIVKIIKDVWWPNAFSPNGDGTNDIWNIKGKRINNIHTLNIYNRWGELVFAAQNIKDGNIDQSAGWDGIFKGEKVLPGVYVFYAEIEYVGSNGFDKYKGEFTLIR